MLGTFEDRGRWRLIIMEEGGRRSVFFPTREEALKFKTGTEREISRPASRRIADALTEWHTQKEASVAKRFAHARSLSQTTIELAKRAIHRAHPDFNDHNLLLTFVDIHYGQALTDRLRIALASRPQ